jgi:hypothetical protein
LISPERERFESQNPYDSLGEAEASEPFGTMRKPRKTKYVSWEYSPTIFENTPRAHEEKYLVIETTSGPKLTELSGFTVDIVLNNNTPK